MIGVPLGGGFDPLQIGGKIPILNFDYIFFANGWVSMC